jgi:hypothetical protein
MPNNLANKTCLVYDNGLFIELAIILTKSFGRVLYYTPSKVGAFPKSVTARVGEGIDGVERINDFWDYFDQTDIFIFPDIYYADLQAQIRRMGGRVWGMGGAEYLELDRWRSRIEQEKLGLPTQATKLCEGIEDLRDYLEGKKDLHVKISTYRGDQETFHYIDKFTMEPMLTKLEHTLGPQKEDYPFVVEEGIEGVEIGYDGWTVDGQFPKTAMYGYEIKGSGYIGKIREYKDFPIALTTINTGLATIFKREGSRGFFSTEVRVGKDRIPYLIDPCMRCGSPPTEVSIECYDNLAEIIWEGSDGNLVVPKPLGKYSAMAVITSEWADSNWMPIEFPEEYRQWIKFRYLSVIDGKYYIAPADTGLLKIGGIVAVEDSIEECFKKIKTIAPTIKGFQLEVDIKWFDEAKQTISDGAKNGVNF